VTTYLTHNRVRLALHELRGGEGRPLLLLHGLGEATPSDPPVWSDRWTGPIVGLDFTGHGASTVPTGGGYTCEVLMSDVATALGHLGPATVVGRGLGAYVALLIAGARPALVRGAVLCDGPGILGGGPGPTGTAIVRLAPHDGSAPDPYALLELSQDIRPPDYAATFLRQAVTLSGLLTPVAVCAHWRPAWISAIAEDPGVMSGTLSEALDLYASVT
jgi:pimeloyl-ACP methyl ester carboxylesterase